MARMWQSGFENVAQEFTTTSGSPTTSTTTFLSGVRSGSIPSLSSGTSKHWSKQANGAGSTMVGPIYFRFYFFLTTAPSAANTIFSNGGGSAIAGCIKLTSTSTLQLFNATTQVGSDSAALNAGQWYRIEMLQDKSGANGTHTLTALIDGSSFASSTSLTLGDGYHDVLLGGNLKSEAQTTAVWFFDDVAVNDSTGTSQNSYPGPVAVNIPENNYQSMKAESGISVTENIR